MRGLVRKMLSSRKGQVLTGILTVVLAASISFAAWTVITGSGTGNGKVGSLLAPTITPSVAPVGDLFPSAGANTGSLQLTVNNPNASPLVLTSLSLAASGGGLTGASGACDFSQASTSSHLRLFGGAYGVLTAQPSGVLNVAIPAGSSQVLVPGALGLDTTAPNACQGVTIAGFAVTNATFSTT